MNKRDNRKGNKATKGPEVTIREKLEMDELATRLQGMLDVAAIDGRWAVVTDLVSGATHVASSFKRMGLDRGDFNPDTWESYDGKLEFIGTVDDVVNADW